jgi:hypothetical protein
LCYILEPVVRGGKILMIEASGVIIIGIFEVLSMARRIDQGPRRIGVVRAGNVVKIKRIGELTSILRVGSR